MDTNNTSPLVGFGAGKVILLGEHSVVYGYPALAGPLSKGVTAKGEAASRCQLVIPEALMPSSARCSRRPSRGPWRRAGSPR